MNSNREIMVESRMNSIIYRIGACLIVSSLLILATTTTTTSTVVVEASASKQTTSECGFICR